MRARPKGKGDCFMSEISDESIASWMARLSDISIIG